MLSILFYAEHDIVRIKKTCKENRWHRYLLIVNGEEVDLTLDKNPLEAIKAYCMVNALNVSCTFEADSVEVVSNSKRHIYTNIEYYADDNSLYSDGTRIA